MIVDRMRSIFKLSQSEYIAAELLTQTYELTKITNQIFIYGDSTRFCLVAVVIQKMEEVAAFMKKDKISQEEYENAYSYNFIQKMLAIEIFIQFSFNKNYTKNGRSGCFHEKGQKYLRKNMNPKELRDFVKGELDKVATEKNLHGYERIGAVTCDSVEWTITNNMLTPTFKLRRKNLTDKYEKVIDDMNPFKLDFSILFFNKNLGTFLKNYCIFQLGLRGNYNKIVLDRLIDQKNFEINLYAIKKNKKRIIKEMICGFEPI